MFNNEFFFLEKNIININSNDKEKIFEKFNNKNEFNNDNLIIKDNNDLIENEILYKINKKKINIYLNDKLILEYFENINNNNNFYPKNFPILFNKFVFICYSENKYFYYNINNNIKFNFNFQGKINLFFYDLNNNNNNKIVFYFLSNNLTLTYFNDNNISKYKLNIKDNKILFELNNNNNNFKYNSIYKCFINNKKYLIFSIKNFILLFNNTNNKYYKLINYIKISNNYVSFLYKNNICLLTKEKIIYEIKIISNKNSNNNEQLFKNISLKENKKNYNELLIKIKILLYYEIMINKIKFSEINNNNKILEIFNNYKISNYIENLNNSINKDNIYFFLKINLKDEILQCIIIYCLIFKKFSLFKKIFNLLDLKDLIIFKIYIKSFIQKFFIDFQNNNNNINIDNIINEIL